jgi:hypothetical protein
MNLLKHMEAAFIASVALTVGGSQLIDRLPEAHARPAAVAAAASPAPAQVVVVKARRMSAKEKRQSLLDHAATASRI